MAATKVGELFVELSLKGVQQLKAQMDAASRGMKDLNKDVTVAGRSVNQFQGQSANLGDSLSQVGQLSSVAFVAGAIGLNNMSQAAKEATKTMNGFYELGRRGQGRHVLFPDVAAVVAEEKSVNRLSEAWERYLTDPGAARKAAKAAPLVPPGAKITPELAADVGKHMGRPDPVFEALGKVAAPVFKLLTKGFEFVSDVAEYTAASIDLVGEGLKVAGKAAGGFVLSVGKKVVADINTGFKAATAGVNAFGVALGKVAESEAVKNLMTVGQRVAVGFAVGTASVLSFTSAADPAGWMRYESALMRVSVAAGSILLPILDSITDWLNQIAAALNDLTPEQQDQIAAWVQWGLVIAGVITGITVVLAILPALSAAVSVLGAAMTLLSGPIGWIVAGLALLVAALASTDEGAEFLQNVFQGLAAVVSGVFNFIKDVVLGIVNVCAAALIWLGTLITQIFRGNFTGAVSAANQAVEDFSRRQAERARVRAAGEGPTGRHEGALIMRPELMSVVEAWRKAQKAVQGEDPQTVRMMAIAERTAAATERTAANTMPSVGGETGSGGSVGRPSQAGTTATPEGDRERAISGGGRFNFRQ